MWEYVYITGIDVRHPITILSELNALGKNRWEFAGILGDRIIMKRQTSNPHPSVIDTHVDKVDSDALVESLAVKIAGKLRINETA